MAEADAELRAEAEAEAEAEERHLIPFSRVERTKKPLSISHKSSELKGSVTVCWCSKK